MTNISSIKKRIDKLKTSLAITDNEIECCKIVVDLEDKGGTFIKYKGQNNYIKVESDTLQKKVDKQFKNAKIVVNIIDDDGKELNLTDMIED